MRGKIYNKGEIQPISQGFNDTLRLLSIRHETFALWNQKSIEEAFHGAVEQPRCAPFNPTERYRKPGLRRSKRNDLKISIGSVFTEPFIQTRMHRGREHSSSIVQLHVNGARQRQALAYVIPCMLLLILSHNQWQIMVWRKNIKESIAWRQIVVSTENANGWHAAFHPRFMFLYFNRLNWAIISLWEQNSVIVLK